MLSACIKVCFRLTFSRWQESLCWYCWPSELGDLFRSIGPPPPPSTKLALSASSPIYIPRHCCYCAWKVHPDLPSYEWHLQSFRPCASASGRHLLGLSASHLPVWLCPAVQGGAAPCVAATLIIQTVDRRVAACQACISVDRL